MDRGRLFILVAVMSAVMLATGCSGDGGSESIAAESGPEVGATSSTGATGDSDASSSKSKDEASDASSDRDRKKSEKSKSKSKSSSGSDEGDSKSKSTAPTVESVEAPRAIEQAVVQAFNQVVSATDRKDANYLCGEAYAEEYVKSFDTRGGCLKVTNDKFNSFTDYSGTVRSVELVTPTIAAANARLQFKKDGKSTTTEPRVHFKFERGRWRVFIYTG